MHFMFLCMSSMFILACGNGKKTEPIELPSESIAKSAYNQRCCASSPEPGWARQLETPTQQPNIVFIFSDDHATRAIGAYDDYFGVDITPNIDQLAREGALLANCFCGNSICGPSRATILTGLHSHVHGFTRNDANNPFDGTLQTFPKLLQSAGYQTAIFGKWHLISDPAGFDEWAVYPGQGSYYNPDYFTANGRITTEGYSTDVTTDKALEWLENREGDAPFLLMVQHKAPHRSWMPGPQDLTRFADIEFPMPKNFFDDFEGRLAAAENEMSIDEHMGLAYDLQVNAPGTFLFGGYENAMRRMTIEQKQAWDNAFEADNQAFLDANPQGKARAEWMYQRYIHNYLRCVYGVDRSVGQITDALEVLGLDENTIVIYSSDQGFYLGEHGWFDKRWMYEPSLEMPFIIRWPGQIQPGTVVDELCQNIDFSATLLDAAGVAADEPMQGESFLPLLRGATDIEWRDEVYYHYMEYGEHNVTPHYGVRTDEWKLMHLYGGQGNSRYFELYNIVADPEEMNNLYGQPKYAEIQAELKAKLRELRDQYQDDIGPDVAE